MVSKQNWSQNHGGDVNQTFKNTNISLLSIDSLATV